MCEGFAANSEGQCRKFAQTNMFQFEALSKEGQVLVGQTTKSHKKLILCVCILLQIARRK